VTIEFFALVILYYLIDQAFKSRIYAIGFIVVNFAHGVPYQIAQNVSYLVILQIRFKVVRLDLNVDKSSFCQLSFDYLSIPPSRTRKKGDGFTQGKGSGVLVVPYVPKAFPCSVVTISVNGGEVSYEHT